MTILTIFFISLVGSTHCAAMCGGFATFCSAGGRSSWLQQIFYNGGRLLIYLILGAAAGYLGSSLNSFGILLGISQISAVILGIIFIIFGISRLLSFNLKFLAWIENNIQRHIFSRYQAFLVYGSASAGWYRPLLVGLFSALLPCGWLYSFVAAAGATGSIESAIVTMFFFWLGTVPMMLSIGRLTQFAFQRWGLESSRIAASLLIVAGFFAISGHLGNPLSTSQSPSSPLSCHQP